MNAWILAEVSQLSFDSKFPDLHFNLFISLSSCAIFSVSLGGRGAEGRWEDES